MANAAEFDRVMVKGAVCGPSKDWIIRVYGREVFNRAVDTLHKDDQAILRSDMGSVGWYPLATWSAFLMAMRREVKTITGEEENVFDRRLVFEGGQQTLIKVYRFVLGFFEPTTVVNRVTPIFRRIFSHGRIDCITNTRGEFAMRFYEAPIEMLEEVKRMAPLSAEFALDLAGQQVTNTKVTHSIVNNTFTMEVKLNYQKRV